MSVAALDWVLNHSRTTGAERMVLVSLANHAGGEPVGDPPAWESWPGVSLIGTEAGLRRDRTTSDVLSRLVEVGAIERLVNSAPDPRLAANRRTNLYRILIRAGESCGRLRCSWCGPERPVAERPPKHAGRGATATRGNATPEAPDLGGQPVLGGAREGRRRATDKPTTTTTTHNPITPGPVPGPGGSPDAPQVDLVLANPTPARKQKAPAQPEARPHSSVADRLARAEWERLPTKPVAGFLALRARIEEALDAGYSEGELSRALPTIKAFTRNGFDLALRQTRAAQPQHDETLDEGRELPSGEVQL